MELLDGTKVANEILNDLKNQVEILKKKGVDVCLGIILVGNRKDSESYVRMKKKRCQEIGITNFDLLKSISIFLISFKFKSLIILLPCNDV